MYDRAKRALDVLVAAAALVVAAPLLLAAAAAIRLTSRGPVVFRQERVGRHEEPFVVLKFRTMYVDADDRAHRDYVRRSLVEQVAPEGGRDGVYKLVDDPRVTPIGRWLRRTSIDELPQLVNVLRGDMSLVGPRPALPYELEWYRPEQRARFRVLPGLTGLWQVEGRSTRSIAEALELDLEYVRRRSLLLDLRILARTGPVVLRGH